MELVTLATCSLNQWALDFDGNLSRVVESCRRARAAGAVYRVGPELELCGYGCEDHFLEADTLTHAWQSLAALLASGATAGVVVDVGMPVLHRGARYNCRVICLDGAVLLVRPKLALADDGNYREGRWFTAWPPGPRPLDEIPLPACVRAVAAGGQAMAPFGVAILRFSDGVTLASETCEELFTPCPPHAALGLAGAEIVANASASHHELRKLCTRVELMRGATASGGVYVYANQRGCDGGRSYYDGAALVVCNGDVVAQGAQFGLDDDVQVVVATVDVGDVRSRRAAAASRGAQAAAAAGAAAQFPTVAVPLAAARGGGAAAARAGASPPRAPVYVTPAEETALGPACWLWDFLRRSGAGGFFLPLSGGADSAAVAAIVGVMCRLVHDAAEAGAPGVLADVRRVLRERDDYVPPSPAALAHRLLHTAYLASAHSSAETRSRAAAVAADVGAYHLVGGIDGAVAAALAAVALLLGAPAGAPRFAAHGGSRTEDLALQNLQARLRMVFSYLLAQLLPWARGGGGGFLLVLSAGNVDEALRGYLTKYDCSSADVNPIGGISKGDLKALLVHAAAEYGFGSLRAVAAAAPTAELVPAAEEGVPPQLDEVDMGMTYAELGIFGSLRKQQRCGPFSMYLKLLSRWPTLSPATIAAKVKHFFVCYSVNRHKSTTLTPCYHAEGYSPDDNRFDLRPFLYDNTWARQFACIDEDVRTRAEP